MDGSIYTKAQRCIWYLSELGKQPAHLHYCSTVGTAHTASEMPVDGDATAMGSYEDLSPE